MVTLNKAQQVLAKTYADGDFAWVADEAPKCNAAAWNHELRHIGDTLFAFLMTELADSEDCTSVTEAARRVEEARDQLDSLLVELRNAEGDV